MTVLADLAARRNADLTVLDDVGLADLGRSIARGRRDLAAFATAVSVEAKRRQESGSSPSPEDLTDPDGEQSQQTQAKDSARGEIRQDLPESGAGAESGTSRTENADHLAERLSRLSPTEKGRLAAHDHEIASNAALLRPEAFRTWLAKLLVKVADPPDDDGLSAAERAKAAAAWTMFQRPDGTWAVAASMDDERGARMDAAVTARAREIANRRPAGQRKVTANDRAVAAFELLCGIPLGASGTGEAEAFRDPAHDNPPGGGGASGGGAEWVMGPDLAVGIIVDAATLAHGPHDASVSETWQGRPIDPRAAQRRACDADWYLILYDHLGQPTRVGRSRRHATRLQRLQLRALYPTCPLDGATPFHSCEIHHVNTPFQPHGETELHNLIPISTTWHHRIHHGGWTLTMDPDRTLRLCRPDGTLDRIIDPPTPITRHGP
ncbi:MAG: hypothetical protein ACE367_15200 [Acidimicrobiales bacterium]